MRRPGRRDASRRARGRRRAHPYPLRRGDPRSRLGTPTAGRRGRRHGHADRHHTRGRCGQGPPRTRRAWPNSARPGQTRVQGRLTDPTPPVRTPSATVPAPLPRSRDGRRRRRRLDVRPFAAGANFAPQGMRYPVAVPALMASSRSRSGPAPCRRHGAVPRTLRRAARVKKAQARRPRRASAPRRPCCARRCMHRRPRRRLRGGTRSHGRRPAARAQGRRPGRGAQA
jgi:hypothetical protein